MMPRTAIRLRAIRHLKDLSARDFARALKVLPSRFYNCENDKPLSKELAITIATHVPGITLDYLFLGKTDGMPAVLARDLLAAENEVERSLSITFEPR